MKVSCAFKDLIFLKAFNNSTNEMNPNNMNVIKWKELDFPGFEESTTCNPRMKYAYTVINQFSVPRFQGINSNQSFRDKSGSGSGTSNGGHRRELRHRKSSNTDQEKNLTDDEIVESCKVKIILQTFYFSAQLQFADDIWRDWLFPLVPQQKLCRGSDDQTGEDEISAISKQENHCKH